MTASTALRTLLLAATPVTALVGQKVRFDRTEQGDAAPYVVLSVADVEQEPALDGTLDSSKTIFRAQIFANQFAQGEAIANAIRAACQADHRYVTGPVSEYLPELDITVPIVTIDWWDD